MSSKNKVVAVVGPTGSGKTALASALARHYNGVIVSADSRQVYRGLDSGTNKEGVPGTWQGETARVIDGVPQLLIDIAQPGSRFTLADWLAEAERLLEKIWAAGQLPIVTGGTGLYVTALLEGYQPGEGRYAQKRRARNFQALILQSDVERAQLYQHSDERFPRVFDAVVRESESLVKTGVPYQWLEAIGLDYRYAAYYLQGTLPRQAAIDQFCQASRHYIRRQLTWWRHHGPTQLVKTVAEATQAVEDFLKDGENPVI